METWVPILAYVVFVGINLLGTKTSLITLFVITGVSVVVLLMWGVVVAPQFSWDRLMDITPDPGPAVQSDLHPVFSYGGADPGEPRRLLRLRQPALARPGAFRALDRRALGRGGSG